MSNPKKNSNSGCFSTFFRRLVCSSNLPTYPDNHHDQSTPIKANPPVIKKFVEVEAKEDVIKPGLVARLMGLDTVPDNLQNESLFFRSKSLNSLSFFPDFNPTKASIFYRRSATASSFSHLGVALSSEINNGVVSNSSSKLQKCDDGEVEEKQRRREKVAVEAKSRGKQRKYEEGYTNASRRKRREKDVGGVVGRRGNGVIRDQKCGLLVKSKGRLERERGVNDVGLSVNPCKMKTDYHDIREKSVINSVDHESLSDSLSLSRSPVSVLDLPHSHPEYFPFKGDGSQTTSKSSRKYATPRNNIKNHSKTQPKHNNLEISMKSNEDDEATSRITEGKKPVRNFKALKKVDDQEEEMVEYFAQLSAQICGLVEDHVRDPRWVSKSQGVKPHFVEELCFVFGGEVLDLMLDELMDELMVV